MSKRPQVKCPTCRKAGDWFAGKHGPFCSYRCKLLDLGKWLNEENLISEPLAPEMLEEPTDLPRGKHEPEDPP